MKSYMAQNVSRNCASKAARFVTSERGRGRGFALLRSIADNSLAGPGVFGRAPQFGMVVAKPVKPTLTQRTEHPPYTCARGMFLVETHEN